MSDEKSILFKVQSLYGRHGRRCGGHKRECGCAIPGEVSKAAELSLAIGAARHRDGV